MGLKKVKVGGSADDQRQFLADPLTKVMTVLSSLVSHCCVTRYDDGSPRRPGWFTVKTVGAAWVVVVKDPDACAQLQATAQSLDDALVLADLLVGSEGAPWEPDPFLRRQETVSKKRG